MNMSAVVIICLIISAVFKGLMDAISDEGFKDLSWEQKYNLTKPNAKHWWYLGLHKPRYRERFPFSSTALVFLTDKWHLYQFFMLRAFYLSVTITLSTSIPIILLNSFVVIPIIHGTFFQAVYEWYRKQLNKQKNR